MRFKAAYFGLFALMALIAAPPALESLSARVGGTGLKLAGFTARAQDRHRDYDDRDEPFNERDNFDQSYQLAPNALVKVSGINGAVTVETTNAQTAEVHIVRSARTRSDLEYHRILVEQTTGGLYIHSERNDDHGDDHHEVRQRVSLRVPRQIELNVSGVNGRTTVGEVDGPVRLSGINGRVEVAQARGYSDISGINGTVVMTVAQLGERGLRVSGVNGGVELRFTDTVNADLHVNGINGSVSAELPNVVVQGRVNRNNFNAQIGAGGAPITVSGINGSVRLAPRS
jgi:hypothetical protein